MNNKKIDTSTISKILNDGNVLFSESNTTLDSCKIYVIEGEIDKKVVKLTVENCNTRALINGLNIQ